MKFYKRIISVILLLLIITGSICIALTFIDYYSYAEEKGIEYERKHQSDTLKVIFIGDSWAAYHSKYDSQLEAILKSKRSIPITVVSKGYVGAKTKAIYVNLSDSNSELNLLIDLSPHYAIISAGINDAVAKIGTKNYLYHYSLIIKYLLSAGIKPIIIDMPQVDYKAVYQRETAIDKIRHQFSSWVTDSPLWDFEAYRNGLKNMIHNNEFNGQCIYIPSSEWNRKGYLDSRQLYLEDHIHLNKKGYHLLDSCLAEHIYDDILSIHDFQ